jgi:hypothetical protein
MLATLRYSSASNSVNGILIAQETLINSAFKTLTFVLRISGGVGDKQLAPGIYSSTFSVPSSCLITLISFVFMSSLETRLP